MIKNWQILRNIPNLIEFGELETKIVFFKYYDKHVSAINAMLIKMNDQVIFTNAYSWPIQ